MLTVFPPYSLYILVYACVAGVFLSMIPAPYGKFSTSNLPLLFNTRWVWVFTEVGALIFFLIETKLPTTTKGWACFVFFLLHFAWRSVVSSVVLHVVTNNSDREIVGDKETSILLGIFSYAYLPVVGLMLRQMCILDFPPIEGYEIIFLFAAGISLSLNIYYDVWINTQRESRGVDTHSNGLYMGKYLSIVEIDKNWHTIVAWGITTPNYFFECLEWFFYMLFAMKWEAVWWFIGTVAYLLPRMYWYNVWYYTSQYDGFQDSSLQNTRENTQINTQVSVRESVRENTPVNTQISVQKNTQVNTQANQSGLNFKL